MATSASNKGPAGPWSLLANLPLGTNPNRHPRADAAPSSTAPTSGSPEAFKLSDRSTAAVVRTQKTASYHRTLGVGPAPHWTAPVASFEAVRYNGKGTLPPRGEGMEESMLQKGDVLKRLRSIEGHIRAVQRMVEEDAYCIDILQQTQAIQGAIDRVNLLILENHLKTCVTTAIRSRDPAERERVISELLQLFRGGSSIGWPRQLRAPGLAELLADPGPDAQCHNRG